MSLSHSPSVGPLCSIELADAAVMLVWASPDGVSWLFAAGVSHPTYPTTFPRYLDPATGQVSLSTPNTINTINNNNNNDIHTPLQQPQPQPQPHTETNNTAASPLIVVTVGWCVCQDASYWQYRAGGRQDSTPLNDGRCITFPTTLSHLTGRS